MDEDNRKTAEGASQAIPTRSSGLGFGVAYVDTGVGKAIIMQASRWSRSGEGGRRDAEGLR